MEIAKKSIETLFPNAKFIGFLAVALGSHVRKKCGKDQTMKKKHRLAMTNLVARETTWICPTFKVYGAVQNCLEEFLKAQPQSNWKDIFLVEVVGGDKAKPSRRAQGNTITVIVSRKGHNEKLLEFQKRPTKKRGVFAGKNPPDKNTFLDGNDMFIDLNEGEDGVSSSRIRKNLVQVSNLTENGKKKIFQELVQQDLIKPVVAQYIMEHWDDLYESAVTITDTLTLPTQSTTSQTLEHITTQDNTFGDEDNDIGDAVG